MEQVISYSIQEQWVVIEEEKVWMVNAFLSEDVLSLSVY